MTSDRSGQSLAAAAVLFWLAWVLMPGVGVTDAEQIFQLVGAQRSWVACSVVVQLVSAVLYVPGGLGLAVHGRLGGLPGVRLGAGLLLVGAMGSAADAVLHLLAYAMTEPGLEPGSLARVMTFMQGPGLFLLAPLIVCFFVGGGWLSFALAKAGVVGRGNPRLHLIALAVAVLGGLRAARGVVPARPVGLSALGLVAAAQAWLGVALWRRPA